MTRGRFEHEIMSSEAFATPLEAQPAGWERASFRELPPPFAAWFSINSDCDCPFLDRYLHIGEVERRELGLPIAGSYFVEWLCPGGGIGAGATLDVEAMLQTHGPWLDAYSRGWFDTIHGWVPGLRVMIAPDVELGCGPRRSVAGSVKAPAIRVARRLGGIGRRLTSWLGVRRTLRFVVPPGWEPVHPPRYLTFSCRLPLGGTALVVRGRLDGRDLFSFRSDARWPSAVHDAAPIVVDLLEIAPDVPPPHFERLEVEFELVGSARGWAEIHGACLVSHLRSDLERQRRWVETVGVRSSVFSSHGVGLVIGPTWMRAPASVDPRCLADRATNPQFCLDVLAAHGTRFINTFSNTSTFEPGRIDDVVFPRAVTGGRVIYDFDRYAYLPRNAAGQRDQSHYRYDGRQLNFSHSDCIGRNIDGFLSALENAPGGGGLLYTHDMVSDPAREAVRRERDAPWPGLNEETRAALAKVADRFHGLTDGEGPRVFVAPTSILLRMAQVRRQLAVHSFHDAAHDAVHVTGWLDPVTGERLPDARTGFRELRWIPFHVRSSATARLYVDGTEVSSLHRFPADETGRETIALADVSAPTRLLGRVPVSERGDVDITARDAELDVPEAGGLTIRPKEGSASGQAELRPREVALADHIALRLVYRAVDAEARLAFTIEADDGLRVRAHDVRLGERSGSLPFSPGPDPVHGEVVLSFARLLSALPAVDRRVPSGRVGMIELEASGGAIHIERVELLRDDERPFDPAGCVVGGRCEDAVEGDEIEMEHAGQRFRAVMSQSGWFVFLRRIPAGEVVRVRRCRAGTGGSWRGYEVVRDAMDLRFAGPDQGGG